MDRKGRKKWWDWCLATEDAVYHQLHPSREAAVVEKLLADYEGVVMSDGFAAYETLTRAGPSKYKCAHCWAHVRRKFIELEPLHPETCGEVLDWIGKLYGLEKTVPDTPDSAELRRKIRDKQSRNVVAEIRDWAIQQRSSPQSGLRKVVSPEMSRTLSLDGERPASASRRAKNIVRSEGVRGHRMKNQVIESMTRDDLPVMTEEGIMKPIALALLVSALLALGCAPPASESAAQTPAVDLAQERAALLAADKAWSESVYDLEAFLSFVGDGAHFMPFGAPLARGEAIGDT
jgi:hypothetical protein